VITEELKVVLEGLSKVGGEDLNALADWFRGNGRAALRDRGASDELLGGFRFEIDKEGDASMSSG